MCETIFHHYVFKSPFLFKKKPNRLLISMYNSLQLFHELNYYVEIADFFIINRYEKSVSSILANAYMKPEVLDIIGRLFYSFCFRI